MTLLTPLVIMRGIKSASITVGCSDKGKAIPGQALRLPEY
jgi:hypothetical protein